MLLTGRGTKVTGQDMLTKGAPPRGSALAPHADTCIILLRLRPAMAPAAVWRGRLNSIKLSAKGVKPDRYIETNTGCFNKCVLKKRTTKKPREIREVSFAAVEQFKLTLPSLSQNRAHSPVPADLTPKR